MPCVKVFELYKAGKAALGSRLFAGLVGAADWTAERFGVFSAPLVADDLIRQTRERSGLGDFGEWQIEAPLQALVDAYNGEARLNVFGRAAATWDLHRFLSNLLRFRLEEKSTPAILTEPLLAPIFVLGLPRSGTTFLHNLLSLDESLLAPRCWQTIYPYPLRAGGQQRDRRADMVERKLRTFARLAPEIRSLHPFNARSPQECTEITAHVLQSRRFDTTHHVPSYRRWLRSAGDGEAYRFHRRFLQHLQYQSGTRKRWVLKCPDHTFAWKALRAAYADAFFVFVHRDPMKILPSVAKLTEVIRRPFTRSVDRHEIGRQVSDDWVEGAARLVEMHERSELRAGTSFHVRYNELVGAPLRSVARLYERLGLTLAPHTERAINEYLEARPRGGYGRNLYRFDEFGLNPAREKERFRRYVEVFGIEQEASAAS